MKNYIITYSYPDEYKGTYLIQGKDGLDASDRLENYLRETYGEVKDSHSICVEVEGSVIQIIGEK